MDKGANLKIIASFGAGYDLVDTAYATKKELWCQYSCRCYKPTAELTLGLMLSLLGE